jgi:hypothetical protein
MTDADLTALWSAWLRDRAQIHKMIHLTSAMFRAHAEAVAAAARRSPPGRVEPIGRVESWEDGRGPNSNVPNGDWPKASDHGPSLGEILHRGSFAGMHRGPDGTLEPERGPDHRFAAGPPCKMLALTKCLPGCKFDTSGPCARTGMAEAVAEPHGQHCGGVTVATVPANKALRKACKPRPELDRLIERARGHVMTDAEIQAQRESWVRGQVGMGNDADEAAARKACNPEGSR